MPAIIGKQINLTNIGVSDMDYEQIMTMGNCGALVEDPESSQPFVGKSIPAPIPTPDDDGWQLIAAVPLSNRDVIQYIWQREKK
ncbi:MAG: hypothetical protein QNL62_04260 [Gammaproteobacteria bacterium]|nr:hypothetical protein [Gammaproteobacteria bacterium]